jgi:hypothetical protein
MREKMEVEARVFWSLLKKIFVKNEISDVDDI